MKKIIALLLACVLCLSFTACRTEATPYGGNTNGNLANGGLVAAAGDRIYYSNSNDGNKLYSMNPNGTDKQKLNDDSSSYINVIGNRIYYSNYSDGRSLYTVNTDGSGRQKLNDGFSACINVVGNRIFYSHYLDQLRTSSTAAGKDNTVAENGIYVMNIDGSGLKQLNTNSVALSICVTGGRIYYVNNEDNGIYSMKTDGSEQKKLGDGRADRINVTGGRIYYSNSDYYSSDNGKIFSIKIDGTDPKKLSDDTTVGFNVTDGRIYYVNGDDNFTLYVMNTDGSGREKLHDDMSVFFIHVAGNRIYYWDDTSANSRMYSVNLNGSDRQAVT